MIPCVMFAQDTMTRIPLTARGRIDHDTARFHAAKTLASR